MKKRRRLRKPIKIFLFLILLITISYGTIIIFKNIQNSNYNFFIPKVEDTKDEITKKLEELEYNKEEIKPKEELVVALKTGGDFGLKSILGSAIKVASEKGVIKFIPKGTPAGVCGTIAFVGVENLKVLTKVATGDLTPREGADKMADVTASTVGGLVSMKFATKWGKKGGEILGMIVGGVFVGGAGASIGKKIGAVAGGFIAGSVAYMAGSKTGHAVYSAAKKVVASAATTVKQVAKNIISSAKNLIANAKAKAKQIFC